MASPANRDSIVLSSPSELSSFLNKSKGVLAAALPKHITPERMIRLGLTLFSTNEQLRRCKAQSILASMVLASQMGLEIGVGGQGYLIPYGTTCTFVPGWRGLVHLLNNTGRATVWSNAVYEGDVWEFQLGSHPKCHHVPGPNSGDPSKLIYVYACGQVNGSQVPIVEAWSIERVWRHRDKFNKVGRRHYSFENPEAYARKVVLLQVMKYMPQSINVENAIAAMHADEQGREIKIDDGVVIDIGEINEEEPKSPAETSKESKAAKELAESSRRQAQAPAPAAESKPADPAPQAEPAPAATPEPVDPRRAMLDELNEILKRSGVKAMVFERACRAAEIIGQTEMIAGLSEAKLTVILSNAETIVEEILSQSPQQDQ